MYMYVYIRISLAVFWLDVETLACWAPMVTCKCMCICIGIGKDIGMGRGPRYWYGLVHRCRCSDM